MLLIGLNIDFLHVKDERGSDQWWHKKYQIWHGLWASRFAQLYEVAQTEDSGPSADFLRWWFLAGKRYLVPAGPFHLLPADDIPVDVTQRQSAPHPQRTQVEDVPDNRRPARRMMIGTTNTARDYDRPDTDARRWWLQAFMALGGTPPSAHMPSPSWEMPFIAPASMPTPPASPAPAEHPDQPLACGRGHRVPRRRGCGTEGHI
ncbi:hypothetical protein PIB30_036129 [Stylosanthes scabra]|uniref:Aminotransferase-like plant mobile domain-containing protein n=1 Tax=Stylosanthes scabra TaxID=79078 RepID=A0ABU6WBE3_9FABA|nr:hypothetical protein [Stylosanthes scabra]